jgi:hypothetical protein
MTDVNSFVLVPASLLEYSAPIWFSADPAKVRLANLRLAGFSNENDTIQERVNKLASLMDLTNEAALAACGGLLQYMDKVSLSLDRNGVAFPVQALGSLNMYVVLVAAGVITVLR